MEVQSCTYRINGGVTATSVDRSRPAVVVLVLLPNHHLIQTITISIIIINISTMVIIVSIMIILCKLYQDV